MHLMKICLLTSLNEDLLSLNGKHLEQLLRGCFFVFQLAALSRGLSHLM